MPQNPTRLVHALLAGFVQDVLINNQNHRHKTDKIIAWTLRFSKNQKTMICQNACKKYWPYLRQVACWKETDFTLTKTIVETKQLFYMLTKTLAEKSAAFSFAKTFAKKRQADFENLHKQTTNKAEATKRSQSKPPQTKAQTKNLEADFSDSTKPTWTFANEENIANEKAENLKTCLLKKYWPKTLFWKVPPLKRIWIYTLIEKRNLRIRYGFAFALRRCQPTVCVTCVWAECGLCLGAGKTRSQKNAWKCRRLPHVRCMLC